MIVIAHESGLWGHWVFDPALVGCATMAALYENGRRRLWRRFGRGRLVSAAQVVSFWAGLAVVVLAVASPLDQLADDLSSAHMVQHLLIGLVGPLLIVAGRPFTVIGFGVPRRVRADLLAFGHRIDRGRGVRRGAVSVALVVVAFEVTAWMVWHVPSLYDAAVEHPLVHDLEHLCFFTSGVLLWWVVVGVHWHDRSGLAVVYLFLAGLPMGALAALITLAPSPLYDSHLTTTAAWGLTPLEDQQLAGAIMWVPGGMIFLTAAIVVFIRWLGSGPSPGEERLSWRV